LQGKHSPPVVAEQILARAVVIEQPMAVAEVDLAGDKEHKAKLKKLDGR
jgi:hypothetical protein